MNSSGKDNPIKHMLNTHSDPLLHPSRFVTPDGQSRGGPPGVHGASATGGAGDAFGHVTSV